MFKYLNLQEQLKSERQKNEALNAKIKAITKEVEIETEQGKEKITEPILKEETEQVRADVDYIAIMGGIEL